MSPSWVVVIAGLVAASGLALAVSRFLTAQADRLEPTTPDADLDTSALGLSRTGPTIVHFTAAWCGPCAAVRRVVDQVCAELPAVAHVEIDMDANPAATRTLSVLSLPTTFVFDADGRQRCRTSKVPTAADLRSTLEPLLA